MNTQQYVNYIVQIFSINLLESKPRGVAKIKLFFSGPAIKRGEGGKGLTTKKKITFFEAIKKYQEKSPQKMWPLSSTEREGEIKKNIC